jgi:copper chaperone CopZ
MKTSVLNVEGMTCRSCVAHVNRALRDVAGVGAVDVRLREGTVTVNHDAAVETLVEALREAGYESSPNA